MPSSLAAVTQQEIPLLGGNTSTVVRVGDTVRRNAGPWTPAVHALLRHLEYVGLHRRPARAGHRRARAARSCRTWRASAAPTRCGPDWVTDEALVTVATMLRLFHDAQYGFRPAAGRGVALVRAAAAGHRGDLPPRRRAAQRDLAAGRHPGAHRLRPGLARCPDLRRGVRRVDLGAAVLRPGLATRWAGSGPNRPRRLRMFADAYGLITARPAPAGRAPSGSAIVDHVEGIRRMAAAGDPAFVRIVHKGHLRRPVRDLRLLDYERYLLEYALR